MSSLLLCATTRLAQTRRSQRPADAAVWLTPQALTVGQWLAQLADEALLCGIAELPLALDPFAERLLWEAVIAAGLDDAAAPLFDIQGMAASAVEAQALARIWQIDPAGAQSDEARLFAGWQAEFLKRCRAGGWIDLAGLQLQVIGLIEAGHFALPASVAFAGFDRYTPLEKRLMAALAARGCAVENAPKNPVDRSEQQVFAAADSSAECAAVAAWAGEQLAANPAARLGIVAPDLASVRDRLEFMLDDLLHPALIRPEAAETPRRFNFSLGRALADLPLIRTGLDLLALGSGRAKLEQSRLSALLLGGGWSAAEMEADGRARLDAALRRDLPYFTTLPALLRLAERLAEQEPALCPRSTAALQAFVEAAGNAPRRQLAGQWALTFRQALQAVDWPGERELSSHEFQARRAFGEVLDGFGRFDALLGPLTQSEAVRRLSQLCRQRIFQPETRGQPAIQVLGVLESAGLGFDALWVMGMNDDLWPPPPRPNPLLPVEALRAAGAAHASAEVELDFATRVQARLALAAPVVNYSWARADGNRVRRPSPLLAGLPEGDACPQLPPSLARQQAATAGADLEQLADHAAPPVGEGEKVAGGSWLLRAQAICPAWAYYQFRLGGAALDEAVEGLDPAARGTLVHEALEAFWSEVRSSDALAALGESGQRAAVAAAVQQALTHFELERRLTLPARFRELEAARLEKLLAVWLALEAKRGVAFEVIACEEEAIVEIEEIRVKMIVDRIDRLADGRQIIIDYKTGAAIDFKNWAAARITEPQLPIYAALVNEDVAAVVFAKVLPDKPAFAGVADAKDILPGVQGIGDEKQKVFDPAEFPDWIAVITHWREALHAVAREVKAGRAGVVFADEKALQYCEVLPLLRLPERRRLLAAARHAVEA
ncbi:PD-(D/E)XK nuclease family protein [Quatrionicoccus australiensis]|uniref:PD-(D/E)XK nuclease family protein n=1 Tax=Quatrionicoccus australiensis TaxID=138118 RepID=UPI001CFB768E|nr:PD-(D/E)XK nuclease family protein [Quatrionicoccus australiensis]MCB4359669.1 PD-(D/E)XK nuclease family protein [Quatrionicoccus australiensis]